VDLNTDQFTADFYQAIPTIDTGTLSSPDPSASENKTKKIETF
jgi:hypothetical protein